MDNRKKSGIRRRWRSFQEQLEELSKHPAFKALKQDIQEIAPDRTEVLDEELTNDKTKFHKS